MKDAWRDWGTVTLALQSTRRVNQQSLPKGVGQRSVGMVRSAARAGHMSLPQWSGHRSLPGGVDRRLLRVCASHWLLRNWVGQRSLLRGAGRRRTPGGVLPHCKRGACTPRGVARRRPSSCMDWLCAPKRGGPATGVERVSSAVHAELVSSARHANRGGSAVYAELVSSARRADQGDPA